MEHNPIIAGGAAYLAVANSGGGIHKARAIKQFFSIIGMKPCPCCGSLLTVDSFHANKNLVDGRCNTCKQCKLASTQKWKDANKVSIAASFQQYYKSNRQEIIDGAVKRHMKRHKEDPIFRLKCSVRGAIRKSIKNKGYAKKSKAHEILGCDYPEFAAHIERQFTKGMEWGMLGSKIHLDHIIPLAAAKTEADVLALNHFTNLRPCWAEENIRKADNIEFLI